MMKKSGGKSGQKTSGRSGGRDAGKRVKTAKGRTPSSQRWLERQLNDPYVREAQRLGYRSRAAFKLKEIDDKLNLIRRGMTVVDLGAAPGGWCQIAMEKGAAHVIALDLLPMEPVPGVTFLQMDFMDDGAPEALVAAIGGGADVVLTDMAPNTTGHRGTDHLRIMALAEAAYEFGSEILKPGGSFVAKVFQGGTEQELLQRLKKDFTSVRHIKPPASRKESAEQFVVATGFRG
ncbi:MAG TPA: RlmE family RNA methyltransferase [Patescibacteria group bacterium]|jgi:23S rRNA (uridine2552-2'-O)-methyltransferase|nr:RlmE family RNA methyltransferase [Patescibacteria group bacterium]